MKSHFQTVKICRIEHIMRHLFKEINGDEEY